MKHRWLDNLRTAALLLLVAVVVLGCKQAPRVYVDDTLVPEALARGGSGAWEAQTGAEADARRVFPLDGMVGQIDGRPIYADSVFHGDDPIHDSLAALGRRLARAQFRNDASRLIESKLRAMVIDALVLAEAERDLLPGERDALRGVVQRHREELIRQFGEGSPAVAQEQILERTGKSFDAALRDYRNTIIVRRYISKVIDPKVNVTRRDVERYYRERQSEFRPPATRTLRLIRVADTAEAEAIAGRLAAGEPFAAVAQDERNRYSAGTGGLMTGLVGDRPLAAMLDPINDRVAGLSVGEAAGPIAVDGRLQGQWFVFVESADTPPQRSLMDVQVQIENTLRNQQRQRLTNRYYESLRSEVSESAVRQMTAALTEIAVSRYAAIDNPGSLAPASNEG